MGDCYSAEDGGIAVFVSDTSTIDVQNSSTLGGDGGDALDEEGGNGGAGVKVQDYSNASFENSNIHGGNGGDCWYSSYPGDGGNGIELYNYSVGSISNSELIGGDGGEGYDGSEGDSGVPYQIDSSSIFIIDGDTVMVIVSGQPIPEFFELFQNFPNPFNSQTTIKYELAVVSNVSLLIYNILGDVVRTIEVGSRKLPGEYSYIWDGKDDKGLQVGTGVYLLKLETRYPVENMHIPSFENGYLKNLYGIKVKKLLLIK